MQNIKNIKIFYNENEKSMSVLNTLRQKLINSGFKIVDEGQDLSIAIGGDGSFIRMLKATDYSSQMLYVGINAGTLGFLQEVATDEIDLLIKNIKEETYSVTKTGIQNTQIISEGKEHSFNSFNEIIIRRKDLNLMKLNLQIAGAQVERFMGDALLISTSVGSTAHNLSYGGAIIHDSLHALQIVPIGVFNSTVNHSLKNPLIVPETDLIEIEPLEQNTDLLVIVDGVNYEFKNVSQIATKVCNKKINRLRLNNCSFFKKINSKFIDNKTQK
ncbi:MAG: NAD(+)/NADH kinase [Spirochaetales bacterium]